MNVIIVIVGLCGVSTVWVNGSRADKTKTNLRPGCQACLLVQLVAQSSACWMFALLPGSLTAIRRTFLAWGAFMAFFASGVSQEANGG